MNPFDKVLAIAQVWLLVLWELLGWVVFGWNPFYILGYWFVGLFSFNILVATAVRTFFKLVSPTATIVNNSIPDVESPDITEEDGVE